MKKLIMYHCSYCGKLICMKNVPKEIPVCCDVKMSLRKDSRWDDMLMKKSARKAADKAGRNSKRGTAAEEADWNAEREAAAEQMYRNAARKNEAEEKRCERTVSDRDIEDLRACMKMFYSVGGFCSSSDSEQVAVSFSDIVTVIRLAALLAYLNTLVSISEEQEKR